MVKMHYKSSGAQVISPQRSTAREQLNFAKMAFYEIFRNIRTHIYTAPPLCGIITFRRIERALRKSFRNHTLGSQHQLSEIPTDKTEPFKAITLSAATLTWYICTYVCVRMSFTFSSAVHFLRARARVSAEFLETCTVRVW